MTPMVPDRGRDQQDDAAFRSVAEELKRESDRLRQLADELKTREAAQAEMQANYPHFKRFVYAALREHFERALPPFPTRTLKPWRLTKALSRSKSLSASWNGCKKGPNHYEDPIMANNLCVNCGQSLTPDQAVCPKCGSLDRMNGGAARVCVTEDAAREAMALKLAQRHYQFEPGITEIRTIATNGVSRNKPNEPVTLLEVNANTVASGVLPLRFDAVPASGFPFPSVIVEVTPEEYEQIKRNELKLPEGWSLGSVLPKPAEGATGK